MHPRISCVGDVFIYDNIREKSTDAVKFLQSSNLVFANLEGALTDRGEKADKWATLRASPRVIETYKRMNISVFTVANNHACDYGEIGLLDTLDNLSEGGIMHVGAGSSIDDAFKPVVLEINKAKIGFIGISSTLPLGSCAGKKKPGIAFVRVRSLHYFDPLAELEQPGTPPLTITRPYEEDMNYAGKKITELKKNCDLLFVGVHWGMPYQENLMDYQETLGRYFIDCGADIVIGSHPHRLQGVEAYKDGIIFYSLGNFMFELPEGFKPNVNEWNYWPPRLGMWSESNLAGILSVSLESNGFKCEFYPTGRQKKRFPRFLGLKESNAIFRKIRELSEGRSVQVIDKDSYCVIQPS